MSGVAQLLVIRINGACIEHVDLYSLTCEKEDRRTKKFDIIFVSYGFRTHIDAPKNNLKFGTKKDLYKPLRPTKQSKNH
jgi:hypothetical protein